MPAPVFLSYRRDDAAGYAGRLEEALEARLGRGSVFRDVQDIAPGADFVQTIRTRLARAHAVLVLIGPRWAGTGADGVRRLDDPDDFVRLEVQLALESPARVVPVLLPQATMPAPDQLPPPLQALARRHALALTDTHWAGDVERLVQAIALPRRRPVWPWAAGAALAAVLLVGGVCAWRSPPVPAVADGPTAGAAQGVAEQRFLGRWTAEVRYDWGARHVEVFEFKRHAGQLTGTASFLGYPRPIESIRVDGDNVLFSTRSDESMDGQTRTKTHSYAAELRGASPDPVLALRLQTTGGFGTRQPVEFEARRVPDAAARDKPAGPPSSAALR